MRKTRRASRFRRIFRMTASQISSSSAPSNDLNPRTRSMPSTQFSFEELSSFWAKVIDPNGIGPAVAIASELAAFTGESVDDVLRQMKSGGADFNKLWHRAEVDTTEQRSDMSLYRDQFIEAYELANWHAGQTYGSFPLNYAKAAFHAKQKGLTRALDFGSGIGSGSIALSLAGCE